MQTHEEAQFYVKELDIFLTMKVLEDTPALLSLGKLCDENGYSYERINGQKPHLIKNGIRIQCQTENFVPIVVPVLSVSTTPQMSRFRGAKVCSKWLQERSDDHNIQSDSKYKSGLKVRIQYWYVMLAW